MSLMRKRQATLMTLWAGNAAKKSTNNPDVLSNDSDACEISSSLKELNNMEACHSQEAEILEEKEAEALQSQLKVQVEIENFITMDRPNQPYDLIYPVQEERSRAYKFQTAWYTTHPWLHWSNSLKKVLCFNCTKAAQLGLISFSKNVEDIFSYKGFSNWKKGKEKLSSHEACKAHKEAISKLIALKQTPVIAQLVHAKSYEQTEARAMLLKLFSSLRFLACRGLPMRGHTNDSANFINLLQLRGEDDNRLLNWLTRSKSFTHSDVQNEMLSLMSNEVLRQLSQSVRTSHFGYFSLIIDGTTDVSGLEQLSFCVRYLRDDFVPEEIFLGLYDAAATDSESIFQMLKDVLLRFQLPMNLVRGQCYDGAANMRGAYSGVQARVQQEEHRAIYVHCANHCINLAIQETCASIPLLRDSLQYVHETAKYFKDSRVRNNKLNNVCKEMNEECEQLMINKSKLRTICPTRFTVRARAIDALLDNYEAVLETLSDINRETTGEVGAKAAGLYEQLQKGSTLLGLKIAYTVVNPCDELSIILQKPSILLSGAQEAVHAVTCHLKKQRTEEKFLNIWNKALETCELFNLTLPQLPRNRKAPRRLEHSDGTPSEPHSFNNCQYFRAIYFEAIDSAINTLEKRFQQPGYEMLKKMESIILACTKDENVEQVIESIEFSEIVSHQGDFDKRKLKLHLQLLGSIPQMKKCESISQVCSIFAQLPNESRLLVSEVERFLWLLAVVPASNASSERSFSLLRRIKTWLRTSMSQERLNACAILSAHCEKAMELDLMKIGNEFIALSDYRASVFGKYVYDC